MAGNHPVILRGDPSLPKVECLLKTITKTWDVDDQGFLEFQNVEIDKIKESEEEVEEKGNEEDLPMMKFLLEQ